MLKTGLFLSVPFSFVVGNNYVPHCKFSFPICFSKVQGCSSWISFRPFLATVEIIGLCFWLVSHPMSKQVKALKQHFLWKSYKKNCAIQLTFWPTLLVFMVNRGPRCPAGWGRWFFPSPLPLWETTWSTASSSGVPKKGDIDPLERVKTGLQKWSASWRLSALETGWERGGCSAWREMVLGRP